MTLFLLALCVAVVVSGCLALRESFALDREIAEVRAELDRAEQRLYELRKRDN